MRTRVSSVLVVCGSFLLISAGCGRAGVVRARLRVVEEELDQTTLVVARAKPAEEPPAPVKESEPPSETVAFHFPADRAGDLLCRELTPAVSRRLAEPAPKPRRRKTAAQLESPELPLPPSVAGHVLVLREIPSRKPLMPRLTTPETLFDLALEVALPQARPLPDGVRTKEAGPDVNKPAPLPILAQPVPDRAVLGDATAEASGAAAVAAPMPARRQPVPFLRRKYSRPVRELPAPTSPRTARIRRPGDGGAARAVSAALPTRPAPRYHPGMREQRNPAVPERPTLVDYFLILAGFSLSLFLIRMKPWRFDAKDNLAAPVADLVAQLGDLIRLTEGVVLLWPLFLAVQSVRGRGQSLTAGEWLWVIAWLCVAVFTGLAAWEHFSKGPLPDWIKDHADTPRRIYYMVVAPAMAALAALFALGGLVTRAVVPWTHSFSLALVTWPVVPLAGILTLTK